MTLLSIISASLSGLPLWCSCCLFFSQETSRQCFLSVSYLSVQFAHFYCLSSTLLCFIIIAFRVSHSRWSRCCPGTSERNTWRVSRECTVRKSSFKRRDKHERPSLSYGSWWWCRVDWLWKVKLNHYPMMMRKKRMRKQEDDDWDDD